MCDGKKQLVPSSCQQQQQQLKVEIVYSDYSSTDPLMLSKLAGGSVYTPSSDFIVCWCLCNVGIVSDLLMGFGLTL